MIMKNTNLETVRDIKRAVKMGCKVHMETMAYEVIIDNKGQYLIKCTPNGHCIGLTDATGTKLNGTNFWTEDFISDNANEFFSGFIGSNSAYIYKESPRILITEGVKYIAYKTGSYWLLDAVASYQGVAPFNKEGFQVWRLKRTKNDSFELSAEDGNGNILRKQKIGYSDFMFDNFEVWCVNGTILLPSEY